MNLKNVKIGPIIIQAFTGGLSLICATYLIKTENAPLVSEIAAFHFRFALCVSLSSLGLPESVHTRFQTNLQSEERFIFPLTLVFLVSLVAATTMAFFSRTGYFPIASSSAFMMGCTCTISILNDIIGRFYIMQDKLAFAQLIASFPFILFWAGLVFLKLDVYYWAFSCYFITLIFSKISSQKSLIKFSYKVHLPKVNALSGYIARNILTLLDYGIMELINKSSFAPQVLALYSTSARVMNIYALAASSLVMSLQRDLVLSSFSTNYRRLFKNLFFLSISAAAFGLLMTTYLGGKAFTTSAAFLIIAVLLVSKGIIILCSVYLSGAFPLFSSRSLFTVLLVSILVIFGASGFNALLALSLFFLLTIAILVFIFRTIKSGEP